MYFLVTEMAPNVPVNELAEHNHDLNLKNPKKVRMSVSRNKIRGSVFQLDWRPGYVRIDF